MGGSCVAEMKYRSKILAAFSRALESVIKSLQNCGAAEADSTHGQATRCQSGLRFIDFNDIGVVSRVYRATLNRQTRYVAVDTTVPRRRNEIRTATIT